MSSEDELRELIDERVAAVHAKDVDALLRREHPEVVTFDVLPPLNSRGTDAAAEQTQAWFDSYSDGPRYDITDLQVHAEDDLGFCSFLYHVTGTLATGTDVDMWVRATLGCRRFDGRWLIVHDHESVPFDPQTGQALISLPPT